MYVKYIKKQDQWTTLYGCPLCGQQTNISTINFYVQENTTVKNIVNSVYF